MKPKEKVIFGLAVVISVYFFWSLYTIDINSYEIALWEKKYKSLEEDKKELEEEIETRDKARREAWKKYKAESKTDERAKRVLKRTKNLVKSLPCIFTMTEWVARVEGTAKIPRGVLKKAIKTKDMTGLTAAQRVRLRRAIRVDPMPECEADAGTEIPE